MSSIGLILFSISSSSFRHCSSKAILAFSASISLISEWKVFVLVSKYSRSRFLSFFSKGQKDTEGPSNKHGYQKDASGYLSQTIHNQVFSEAHFGSGILIEICQLLLPFLTVIHQGILEWLEISLNEVNHHLRDMSAASALVSTSRLLKFY